VDFALATGGSASGQIVVICGRNRSLLSRLEARTWKTPTRLLGFVENVPEWMNASDCIVTKAGPGAIAESCICALPMILSGFIPGQEEANIGWVVGHQAGVAITEPSRIGSQVADWFGAQFSERRKLAENARRLGRPRATFDIVDSIVTILDES
jgi:1,2-diacylglycerol 3-beta-galactosyltransferase